MLFGGRVHVTTRVSSETLVTRSDAQTGNRHSVRRNEKQSFVFTARRSSSVNVYKSRQASHNTFDAQLYVYIAGLRDNNIPFEYIFCTGLIRHLVATCGGYLPPVSQESDRRSVDGWTSDEQTVPVGYRSLPVRWLVSYPVRPLRAGAGPFSTCTLPLPSPPSAGSRLGAVTGRTLRAARRAAIHLPPAFLGRPIYMWRAGMGWEGTGAEGRVQPKRRPGRGAEERAGAEGGVLCGFREPQRHWSLTHKRLVLCRYAL